ncbi:acetylglucosamine-6-sulfatase [Haloferula helveola]|uniref:Acetylglucosamine-6-sulfatase n=1 Tax=Haloferula helveola TaxID=490095 RepID=A0ABN6H1J5_9BACT|nr:acetylglucosamine-6-sulfatase [Haloferula helveola]
MTRIPRLLILLLVPAFADERPNVLFIMSDDHTRQAISAYGSRLAEIAPTPTIDRLAKEGIMFENACCTNAICTPSRACIITGQYNHTNGVFDLGGRIEPSRQTLAIEMGKAGYETAMIGKWHLKAEPAAFDYYCVLPGQGSYFNPEFRVRGEKPWPGNVESAEGHSTDIITDRTLAWLKSRKHKDRPFFLMHHYKAPHDYFENAPRYKSYLSDTDIPAPDTLWDSHPEGFGSIATRGADDELIPHIGTSIGLRNPRRNYVLDLSRLYPDEFPENYDPADHSERENKRLAYNAYLRKYLRCVRGIDDNLARLFAYLEESGQMDNTVILYTGDQGFMLGEHDYQDKRWMFDETQRMPFLVRYPKSIRAGTVSDAIVENVDFGPTMLAFAGIGTPGSMQGKSFKEICETGEEPAGWKQEAYYRYWMHMAHHDNPGQVGIRTKTHKLIFYYGADYKGGYRTPPGWELYDLAKDPEETVNRYGDPAYAAVASELKTRLAALRKRVGDDGSHYPETEAVLREFWGDSEANRAEAVEISHEFLKLREAELKKAAEKRKR